MRFVIEVAEVEELREVLIDMQQSYLDTDIGNAEFELLKKQEHVDEVWSAGERRGTDGDGFGLCGGRYGAAS